MEKRGELIRLADPKTADAGGVLGGSGPQQTAVTDCAMLPSKDWSWFRRKRHVWKKEFSSIIWSKWFNRKEEIQTKAMIKDGFFYGPVLHIHDLRKQSCVSNRLEFLLWAAHTMYVVRESCHAWVIKADCLLLLLTDNWGSWRPLLGVTWIPNKCQSKVSTVHLFTQNCAIFLPKTHDFLSSQLQISHQWNDFQMYSGMDSVCHLQGGVIRPVNTRTPSLSSSSAPIHSTRPRLPSQAAWWPTLAFMGLQMLVRGRSVKRPCLSEHAIPTSSSCSHKQ